VLLKGRTVLVTGGASGLGGATVDTIVAAGGRAVVIDLKDDVGSAKAAQHGSSVRFVKGDVTREDHVQAAIDTATREFGQLDGLVNAAGIPAAERVLGKEGIQPLDHFTRVIHVNLVGTFNAIRLAGAAMATNTPSDGGERGVIVNTASVAAFDGQIGQASYSSSKGGIVGLTLPAARELAQFGIRVCAIAPGIFYTPMLMGLTEEIRASLAASIPFPQVLGKPEQYAALARHIVENRYLNGETIRLDGALRMAPK